LRANGQGRAITTMNAGASVDLQTPPRVPMWRTSAGLAYRTGPRPVVADRPCPRMVHAGATPGPASAAGPRVGPVNAWVGASRGACIRSRRRRTPPPGTAPSV